MMTATARLCLEMRLFPRPGRQGEVARGRQPAPPVAVIQRRGHSERMRRCELWALGGPPLAEIEYLQPNVSQLPSEVRFVTAVCLDTPIPVSVSGLRLEMPKYGSNRHQALRRQTIQAGHSELVEIHPQEPAKWNPCRQRALSRSQQYQQWAGVVSSVGHALTVGARSSDRKTPR